VSKKKHSKCYCLSNSPVKEPTFRFPNGATVERLARFQSLFYRSLCFPNEQGLLIEQNLIFMSQYREWSAPSISPNGPLRRQLPLLHRQYIIHLFTGNEQLHDGFSTSQDRMYGDVCSVCILIWGMLVQGEIRERSKVIMETLSHNHCWRG
jgi:hypothetical protein